MPWPDSRPLTPRDRFLQTLLFGSPDRVPFEPGQPRESTLAAWRAQGFPAGVHWRTCLYETLGLDLPRPAPMPTLDADFRMIPRFEEKVLERRDDHLVVQDWKGNVCEISDRFDPSYLREAKDFVTRRWLRCPVETRDDWPGMRRRYDADDAARLPADFADRCRALARRETPLIVAFPGPFWQMREWCGFEGLCLLMVEQPDFVDEMAAAWSDFVARLLERFFAGIVPDMIHLSEDMAYKEHAMISPAMVRRFCMPSWRRWSEQARAAGCPLVAVDSDGFVGELIPLWIESGVNVCDPMEVAAGNDIGELRRLHGRRMAFRGGVDKRAMARGGADIREELRRIEPVVRSGGCIPSCDHAVPPDVSWPAYLDYARLLAQITGWL